MKVKVALIYPYLHPANDNSIFRLPLLGLAYIAAALRKRDVEVELVDCTFLRFKEAVERVKRVKPHIAGFYAMFSMKKTAVELANAIKNEYENDCLLVVRGPLPSHMPEGFLNVLDVVAVGEGEETMPELVDCIEQRMELSRVKGLVYKNGNRVVNTGPRLFIRDLDSLAFPT
jgi:anaerobic magnesium-protoporphyrin IX monomethyl ester cyclase